DERDDAFGDGQADEVEPGEQDALAQQRLVHPVPEGPEPAAEIGERGGRDDGQPLGDHRPDAERAVQVGRATQVDDGADQADQAEFRELRNQFGEALAKAHHPGHTKRSFRDGIKGIIIRPARIPPYRLYSRPAHATGHGSMTTPPSLRRRYETEHNSRTDTPGARPRTRPAAENTPGGREPAVSRRTSPGERVLPSRLGDGMPAQVDRG